MNVSQLWHHEIVHSGSNTSFAACTCWRSAKCIETLLNIILGPMEYNGCFTTLVSGNSAFRPKQKFCILLHAEGLRSTPKHCQTSFWFQWSRMDASQLWYPEIVHSGPNTSFASFYLSKVSEILRNTPKDHFGSNWVELVLHNFGNKK
jgi:hypothetical protein